MAQRTKSKAVPAEYDRDTAKGKRRYRVGESGDDVVGTIYISSGHPLFEEDSISLTLTAGDAGEK